MSAMLPTRINVGVFCFFFTRQYIRGTTELHSLNGCVEEKHLTLSYGLCRGENAHILGVIGARLVKNEI